MNTVLGVWRGTAYVTEDWVRNHMAEFDLALERREPIAYVDGTRWVYKPLRGATPELGLREFTLLPDPLHVPDDEPCHCIPDEPWPAPDRSWSRLAVVACFGGMVLIALLAWWAR